MTDAIVGSFAADHVVTEPALFERTVRHRGGAPGMYLVTIGIEPSYPETGYGYISAGRQIGDFEGLFAAEVSQFKEKPDYATARDYVESGRYLWNASMFVWQARVLRTRCSACCRMSRGRDSHRRRLGHTRA